MENCLFLYLPQFSTRAGHLLPDVAGGIDSIPHTIPSTQQSPITPARPLKQARRRVDLRCAGWMDERQHRTFAPKYELARVGHHALRPAVSQRRDTRSVGHGLPGVDGPFRTKVPIPILVRVAAGAASRQPAIRIPIRGRVPMDANPGCERGCPEDVHGHNLPQQASIVCRLLLSFSTCQDATATYRVSRITVTLIWPGYCKVSWICSAISRPSSTQPLSSMSLGCTSTRSSRPACRA